MCKKQNWAVLMVMLSLVGLAGCSTQTALTVAGAVAGGVLGSETGVGGSERMLQGGLAGAATGAIAGYAYEKGKEKGTRDAEIAERANRTKNAFWDRQAETAQAANFRVSYYNMQIPRGTIRQGGVIQDEHIVSIPIVE